MTDEHERNNRWIIDKPFRDAHKDIDSNLAGWDYIKKLESEAAQSAEKIARLSKVIMPMQDAIDERDEKIARLEAENASLGAQIDRLNDQCDDWKEQAAAAELSNKQLREVLEDFARGQLQVPNFEVYVSATAKIALAQQPSTEALDAYVAKLIPPGWRVVPIEPTANMLEAAWSNSDKELMAAEYRAMLKVAPLPPAPDKDKEQER